ncbi:hypothetical protein E2L92_21960 [Salmonella enterica subsp. enterica serovar Ibadan]|nr:hypothetical protein [Salmonella enterica subsp. enterica serovar Ibadan]ECF3282118.1 hypothetical protein [Salmonella enterica subsp. enterica serovar Ibadan]
MENKNIVLDTLCKHFPPSDEDMKEINEIITAHGLENIIYRTGVDTPARLKVKGVFDDADNLTDVQIDLDQWHTVLKYFENKDNIIRNLKNQVDDWKNEARRQQLDNDLIHVNEKTNKHFEAELLKRDNEIAELKDDVAYFNSKYHDLLKVVVISHRYFESELSDNFCCDECREEYYQDLVSEHEQEEQENKATPFDEAE